MLEALGFWETLQELVLVGLQGWGPLRLSLVFLLHHVWVAAEVALVQLELELLVLLGLDGLLGLVGLLGVIEIWEPLEMELLELELELELFGLIEIWELLEMELK